MTAVNAGVHELAGVRLPLQPYTGGHAVFMYSTAADGNVTLQLKEPDDLDRGSLAAMLARLQDDATFSISYQDTDILSDGSIDVLLGTGSNNSLPAADGSDAVTATFDLFDSSSGPDLTLSPQTFTNSAEAFINDNSNSLGVPAENDPVSSTDDGKKAQTEVVKLAVKRARPKATSPNRQGPQQCQVCAKIFGNASALAKHKLTHSDERKYVCTMCGKAFKRQDHLNGHMLTHRNKKPYECKAEGCGKSYCDARSLRRHTENHHSTSSTSANAPSTTMSPAQGAASGDAASPHGSSCIQYAPPPTNNPATGKSQLQQLLATEPSKSGSSGNNDGLTKQQLDLIHQIMEQTQRHSQTAVKSTAKQPTKPVSKTAIKVQRIWSSQQSATFKANIASPNQANKASSTTTSSTTTSSATSTAGASSTISSQANSKTEQPKPVECNLCHRKFKNVPALNGHMRLHGGYFKKDADSKKSEKKDTTGPPLQTASVSVRALIEEKIINKRITNAPTAATTAAPATTVAAAAPADDAMRSNTAPPLFPLTVHSTTAGASDANAKITSFVVPAPPQQLAAEKSRRHSDADAFTMPRAASTTQQEAEALADLILKHEKAAVKRTVSDPGQQPAASPQQQQQVAIKQEPQLIQFQSAADSFTLAYPSEDGYLSPGLQDEVFTQVPESMLLQGVDAQQLASIQFQADSLLQDQSDQQLLDDYTTLQDAGIQSPSYQSSHNQELQAVLDSPLPESLAEFSTYHSSGNLDLPSPGYHHAQSPVQYAAQSPHVTLAARSPLQSPLIRHDSPGFAYPTPPASHEGLSPCFGQNSMLPLVSPKQSDFAQVLDDPQQPSSPLTAAFFTSNLSSAAAVEEALEEVLPGENISADELYPSLTNSPPPPQSLSPLPVGLTPIASPAPASVASASAASTHTTYTQNTVSFPMTTHFTLQSQMMPNSDDPLLSSSPKDFVPRKKFEFNGLPLKVISNGLIDLNNTNLTGILVESNGEIKFIQTGGPNFPAKNILVASAPMMSAATSAHNHEASKAACFKPTLAQKISKVKTMAVKSKEIKLEDITHDVFLSPPTSMTSNPGRLSRKRPRTDPLQLPVLHQSRLRATRSKPQGAAPYTPQPILNPSRPGSGLYIYLKQKTNDHDEVASTWCNEAAPESDSTPHINVGPKFQCSIPAVMPSYHRATQDRSPEDLLWDPGILQCSDSEVDMYLDFACCAAVPAGGRNQEYAMHLLHMCAGNIHEAMLKLMQPTPHLPSGHPLLSYQYSETDKWTAEETELFHQALLKHDKDFYFIAQEVGTKSLKQCVQFYYMWKKVCTDEYRKHKEHHERSLCARSFESCEEKPHPDAKLLGIADAGSPMPLHEHRNYICEFADCSASFNSRAALNGHIRIHGGTVRGSPPPPAHCHATPEPMALATSNAGANGLQQLLARRPMQACHAPDSAEDYPCKICGKVFTKIKSRSAHMKSHRPPDAEPSRPKQKDKEHILTLITTTSSGAITAGATAAAAATQSTFDSVPTSSST